MKRESELSISFHHCLLSTEYPNVTKLLTLSAMIPSPWWSVSPQPPHTLCHDPLIMMTYITPTSSHSSAMIPSPWHVSPQPPHTPLSWSPHCDGLYHSNLLTLLHHDPLTMMTCITSKCKPEQTIPSTICFLPGIWCCLAVFLEISIQEENSLSSVH